jgi:hypothetical protein
MEVFSLALIEAASFFEARKKIQRKAGNCSQKKLLIITY